MLTKTKIKKERKKSIKYLLNILFKQQKKTLKKITKFLK